MYLTDPIADMLTRIRNASMARHEFVMVPQSKIKANIARSAAISGLQRVSKPGLRVYVGKGEIPRVYGGLGIAIVSTPRGLMTGQQAWRDRLGGELLCYVW
jgi:small subunit ribosomal protein S8